MAFTDDAPVHLLKKKSAPRHKAGTWVELGGKKYYFRSAWEERFARWLQACEDRDWLLSWAYEPRTFWFLKIKRGVRSYKPDFRVKWKNGDLVWYEVKGFMDKRSATKLKRMAKYYPGTKVVVVGPDWFNSGSVLPGCLRWRGRKNRPKG